MINSVKIHPNANKKTVDQKQAQVQYNDPCNGEILITVEDESDLRFETIVVKSGDNYKTFKRKGK